MASMGERAMTSEEAVDSVGMDVRSQAESNGERSRWESSSGYAREYLWSTDEDGAVVCRMSAGDAAPAQQPRETAYSTDFCAEAATSCASA